MKKLSIRALAMAIALIMLCCASAAIAEENANPGTKLYTVTVTLDPKDVPGIEVTGAGIRGEFLFYESNMTGHTDETGMADVDKYYTPHEYKPGMASIGALYYEDMTLNADGLYEITLELPAGAYPYQFIINPELGPENPQMCWFDVVTKTGEKGNFGFGGAGKNKFMPDPKNPPIDATLTGEQANSVLIVGDTARAPIADPALRGTVTFQTYTDVDGKTQAMGVYGAADQPSQEETIHGRTDSLFESGSAPRSLTRWIKRNRAAQSAFAPMGRKHSRTPENAMRHRIPTKSGAGRMTFFCVGGEEKKGDV